MTTQAQFTLRGRNPDILSCIASLSNDEVFTPPEFANRMLDTIADAWAADHNGASIWEDSNVTFLDPCTKSGVFLREITRRLTDGLAKQIPDLQTRVDHILTKQVFGIGITRLTSLMARRSLYCTKHANGAHSIAKSFTNDAGNIWYDRMEHTWEGSKCVYCGAPKTILDREGAIENYAYAFIHTDNIKSRLAEMFGATMQFDVIIGNPPYQIQDAGHAASAMPIYHHFVKQAINLEPRYLSMVTPSRWFVGGKGLDEFRSVMLNDSRLKYIQDYIVDKDAFPKININGGVSFFLWQKEYNGECTIRTIEKGGADGGVSTRRLNEFDVLVRRSISIKILRKVKIVVDESFSHHVSSRKPFGLPTNYHGTRIEGGDNPIKLYGSGAITWISADDVLINHAWVSRWKVLIAAASDGNENYPLPIWDAKGPFVAGPGEACSETYLVASLASSRENAEYVCEYMRTKFFRFLVSLRKIAQHNKADNFCFVPDISMDRLWTDKLLYEKYCLTEEEIQFIESMIRTMDWGAEHVG